MGRVRVCAEGELAAGEAKMVEVEGTEVGVFRVEGAIHAIENSCPHRDGYLHDGDVVGKTVVCPWHFSVFDLETGKVLEGPAESDRKTFRVVCENGSVCVDSDG